MFLEFSLLAVAVGAFGCALMPLLRPTQMRMLAWPLGPPLVVVELLASLPASASPPPPALRLLDATAGDSQEPDVEISESADVQRKLHQYRVVPGDSLWAIACRDLGSSSDEQIDRRWRQIYAENREIIGSNPDLIFPGQKLSIPESTDG
ncbi:MAG: LysM peptidoglycan-binding domain-containing protein [Acidimicrobiia bacterium]|nr:LysM peptidoglycan-binding domain-containing protein [Acidimicrobiia bacterium]